MLYNSDELVDRHGINCGKWKFMPVQNSYADTSTLPFQMADMDSVCPDRVIEALHRWVDNKTFGYSADLTEESFRSICGWFQHRFDWYVSPKGVYYYNGIVPAINYLVQIMTHEGDQVLLQPPIYRPFYNKINCTHRTPAANELVRRNDRYEADFEDFEKRVKDAKTTPFPLCSLHNPTGRVWSEEELRRMGELRSTNDVCIIADEIHHGIVAPGVKHTTLERLFPEHKNEVITCAPVSKTFNPAGLTYSNIIIHDPHLKTLWDKLAAGDYGVVYPSLLSITAIEAAYATEELWIDQLNGYLHDNLVPTKDYLAKHLSKAKMGVPEGIYFAWIDVEPYLWGAVRADVDTYPVKTADILIESGKKGAPILGPSGEHCLRMNTACPRSMLEEGSYQVCQVPGRVSEGVRLDDAALETPWRKGTLPEMVDRPTFLIFLRYYGYTVCQLDMRRLKEQYEKSIAAGARALVVLQSAPEGIREQIGADAFSSEIIRDPEQQLYKQYHVALALSMEKMVDLQMLKKMGTARVAGPTHGAYEGNRLQSPAIFLVEPGLTVKRAHYGTTPADLPDVSQMAGWLKDKEEN